MKYLTKIDRVQLNINPLLAEETMVKTVGLAMNPLATLPICKSTNFYPKRSCFLLQFAKDTMRTLQ